MGNVICFFQLKSESLAVALFEENNVRRFAVRTWPLSRASDSFEPSMALSHVLRVGFCLLVLCVVFVKATDDPICPPYADVPWYDDKATIAPYTWYVPTPLDLPSLLCKLFFRRLTCDPEQVQIWRYWTHSGSARRHPCPFLGQRPRL